MRGDPSAATGIVVAPADVGGDPPTRHHRASDATTPTIDRGGATPNLGSHPGRPGSSRFMGEDEMNINKYTEKAQEAVLGSQQIAAKSSHALIEPEHLLVTLVEQREGVVPEVLRKMSADPTDVARAARELLTLIPQAYGGAQPGVSPRLKIVTDLAEAEATRLKDEYVSTE